MGKKRSIAPSIRFSGLLLLFLAVAPIVRAQSKAFATLKPDRIETGDTTTLTVIVSGLRTRPGDVDFISWKTAFPLTNIRASSDWRQSGAQWIRQYTLIAFDSASLELPALSVLTGVGKPLNTNTLNLDIIPAAGGEISDMAPLRDIYREPVSWTDYWPWALGALAVLVLVIVYFRRKPKKAGTVAPPVPVSPPQISATETALQKLNALESRQLWKNGQEKEHHTELSIIVREYLESNYKVAALESTSTEILALLKSGNFSAVRIPLLQEILNKTDMVKFAQSRLPEAAHEMVLEKARELITPDYFRKAGASKPPVEKPPLSKPRQGNYEPL